jgi:glutamate carboxypeptidase
MMREILEEVRSRSGEWIGLVEDLASLESPTTEPASQLPVQRFIGDRLAELGFRIRRFAGRQFGGMVLARPSEPCTGRWQLLLGHSDTVWSEGTLEHMPVLREGGHLLGPGVFDMKGGIAHVILALRVLRDLKLRPEVLPVVLINSDEEVGSPESTRSIRRLSRGACRAFVMEPALGVEGRLKTVRKGTGKFRVKVTGISAHAGLDPGGGASAIQELSHVIQELHALSDLETGLVVNVGAIRGGSRSNVVAAEASAEVDVRINSMEEGRWIVDKIRSIRPVVPRCHVEIEGGIDRPPLEATPANRMLWRRALETAGEMGIELDEGRAGGASDGNTASRFTATLDGLGAVGDGAHAQHEYVDVDRSIDRCALLAGLLMAPAEPGPGVGTDRVKSTPPKS